jgi:hypothetical protein
MSAGVGRPSFGPTRCTASVSVSRSWGPRVPSQCARYGDATQDVAIDAGGVATDGSFSETSGIASTVATSTAAPALGRGLCREPDA